MELLMRLVKKFFAFFGAACFAFMLYLVAMMTFVKFQVGDIDKSSQNFIDEAIPAFASSWSLDELKRRGTSELANGESLDSTVRRMSELGDLVRYEGSEGSAKISINFFAQKDMVARYKAKAIFKNQRAEFLVDLKYLNDHWEISNLKVESPLFGGS
jgi:hypothetical protein